jgi:hypothetical protein
MTERIVFSRWLYLPEAVRAAADQYASVARISVEVGPDEVVATIAEADPEVAGELPDAFSNHVLFETIVRSRRAGAGGP